jgi:hypothetical protein
MRQRAYQNNLQFSDETGAAWCLYTFGVVIPDTVIRNLFKSANLEFVIPLIWFLVIAMTSSIDQRSSLLTPVPHS